MMPSNQTDSPMSSREQANERKRTSTTKYRRLELTCVVCDGTAYGYNFDAISCESCKAFFRRNALRSPGKLKCSHDNRCNVRFDHNKRCRQCRLTKCLSAGMRKDWILTEKEKEAKRLKVEENRRLRQRSSQHSDFSKAESTSDARRPSLLSFTRHPEYLQDSDLSKLNFLQNAYDRAIELNPTSSISKYPSIQPINSIVELFLIPIHLSCMRLISYFKQIPEFQQLTVEEQVHLVKTNILPIAFLHSVFIYDPQTGTSHEPDRSDPLFLEKDWLTTISKEFHQEMQQIRHNLSELLQVDRRTMLMVFLVHLFSNHSISGSSPIDLNTVNILRAQNVYNDLLWKYCLQRWDFVKSVKLLMQYTNNFMKLQTLISELRATIADYVDVTKLAPLVQSLV